MTFNQMNYFITVARYMNFSRAATTLFVTQSTLSRSIAAMESELNVTLFDRRYHNLKLTPAGELLYREGQVFMENMNVLFNRLQTIEGSRKKRLAIGVLDGQKADNNVILTVKNVLEKVPEFTIDIRRIDYDSSLQGLKDMKVDVAQMLVPSSTELADYIGSVQIGEENYYLVGRNDDPIWEEPLELTSLNGKKLLLPRTYPGNDSLLQCLEEAGVNANIRPFPDMETLSLWLESGIGVTICNASHVACASGIKRPVRFALLQQIPPIPMMLLWNRDNVTPLLEMFLSLVEGAY